MKKIFLALMAVAIAWGTSDAQTVKIMKNGVVVATYTSADHDEVVFEEENGPKMVDLGLSVKWANMNIGATNGDEANSWYGSYFAWGETESKNSFAWSNYRWCNGSRNTLTKYCYQSEYGTVDDKTVLEAEDDAAIANWGSAWRMPTLEEQDELRDECTWTWTTKYKGIKGLNGYLVTGPNGNSIFLPAAGYRENSTTSARGTEGYYWSATLSEYYSANANYIIFNVNTVLKYGYERYFGYPIRPVSE